MKSVFLETRNVQAGREALNRLEDIDKGQPGLGVFWGQAGRGKTLFAREVAVRTGAVYLRVMEDWTPRAMLAALCRELNGSEPRTVESAKTIACRQLESMPRTVLVDEADRLSMNLVEHFRDIHDLTGVPVVLIGEEHLYPILNARRRLWSRVTQAVEFGPITSEDIMLFGLKASELRINPDAAHRMAVRASGDFRLVWQDVHDLEQVCRAAGSNVVDVKMVEALPARNRARKNGVVGGKNGGRGGK